MGVTTALATIGSAIETAKKLRDISKAMANAELKGIIAELSNQLVDVNLEMAGIKAEIGKIREENLRLKSAREGQSPKWKWGCYVFDGDDTLYCPGCYSSEGKKHPTTRLNVNHRRCTVCGTVLGCG